MRNSYPIKSGYGDLSDLSVFLHEDSGQSWFPQVNRGWYYLGAQEDYLFALEGNEDVTVPVLSSSVTLSTVSDLRLPSRSGPIIVDSDTTRYTRVTSNLGVFYPVVPAPASGTILMSFSVSGQLAFLTGKDGEDMISVPSTGSLQERNYYYYDEVNNLVWVARNLNDTSRAETLYLTYLKDTQGIIQEEILLVDSDGNLRTMLDRVFFSASASAYNPVIISPSLGTFHTTFVSGNVLYPDTALAEDERIGVRYYVNYSYSTQDSSPNTLYTFTPSGEPATVRWENSLNTKYNDVNTVELNPLLSGISPGFLYIDQPRHPAETLSTIRVRVAPLRVISKYRQPIRIVVNTSDNEGHPLNNVSISCWVKQDTDPTTIYSPYTLDSTKTNYKGQSNFMWESKPQFVGNFTAYASGMSASGVVITDSCQFTLIDPPILTDMVRAPKCFLFLNPNLDASGLQDLYIYMSTQAGIPYPTDFKIRVNCKLGTLYYSTNYASSGSNVGAKELILSFSQAGVTEGIRTLTARYASIVGDEIIATVADNTDSIDSQSITVYKFESTPLSIL